MGISCHAVRLEGTHQFVGVFACPLPSLRAMVAEICRRDCERASLPSGAIFWGLPDGPQMSQSWKSRLASADLKWEPI